ncbi:MAG: phosphotransferase [Sphingomonadales bacterium]|nr:phosphotransferase [Sphingomonadales bacterium]
MSRRTAHASRYYIRGPRGDNYVSPIDMAQEAAIHRAYLANGIPAPRPIAVIDDPCSLVLERLPGTINTETIADPAARQRVREEFIEIVARQHQIPLDQFAAVGLDIPVGADAVSRNLYVASEAIFDTLIGRPWPLVRFVGRWLKRHVPQDRTRAAFINGDAGQFMFEGDHITGLIDFEMSAFGDPAAELAGMRLRDTSEPLGDLSALYDHYENAERRPHTQGVDRISHGGVLRRQRFHALAAGLLLHARAGLHGLYAIRRRHITLVRDGDGRTWRHHAHRTTCARGPPDGFCTGRHSPRPPDCGPSRPDANAAYAREVSGGAGAISAPLARLWCLGCSPPMWPIARH